MSALYRDSDEMPDPPAAEFEACQTNRSGDAREAQQHCVCCLSSITRRSNKRRLFSRRTPRQPRVLGSQSYATIARARFHAAKTPSLYWPIALSLGFWIKPFSFADIGNARLIPLGGTGLSNHLAYSFS